MPGRLLVVTVVSAVRARAGRGHARAPRTALDVGAAMVQGSLATPSRPSGSAGFLFARGLPTASGPSRAEWARP